MAALTEVIGGQDSRRVETCPANGNSGNVKKRLAANAAIFGEDLLKKTAERLFCERQNGAAEIG